MIDASKVKCNVNDWMIFSFDYMYYVCVWKCGTTTRSHTTQHSVSEATIDDNIEIKTFFNTKCDTYIEISWIKIFRTHGKLYIIFFDKFSLSNMWLVCKTQTPMKIVFNSYIIIKWKRPLEIVFNHYVSYLLDEWRKKNMH